MRITTILSIMGLATASSSFEKNYSFKYDQVDELLSPNDNKTELSYSYQPKLEEFQDEE